MVRRTSFERAECPIARSLDVVGAWWSLLIIRAALLGNRRFGEPQRSLGLAKNILTVRLRALVDHGLLKAVPSSDGSAYQEYALTRKGSRRVSDPGGFAAVERGIRREATTDPNGSGGSRKRQTGAQARAPFTRRTPPHSGRHRSQTARVEEN